MDSQKESLELRSLYVLFITGFYFNFSILNIGDRGIPAFWVFSILIGLIFIKDILKPKTLFSSVFFLVFSLVAVVLIQLIATGEHVTSSMLQLISRLSLILYCLVMLVLISKISKSEIIKLLSLFKWLVLITIWMGLYEAVALNFNLPIYHHVLANNPSFSQATVGVINGWNESLRIRGPWGEASYSACFVMLAGVIFTYYRKHTNSNLKYFLLMILLGGYSYFTYSRVVWFVYSVTLLLYIFDGIYSRLIIRVPKSLLYISFGILFLGLNSWVFVVDLYFDDSSATGRSSSIIVGMKIWLDHILLGTGLNTFADYSNSYITNTVNATDEPVVHNLFVGMVQQIGLFGFPYLFYIFKLLSDVSHKMVFVFISFMWLIIGSLFGDFFYFGITWLTIALCYCFYRLDNDIN